jgi:cell division protein ZapE
VGIVPLKRPSDAYRQLIGLGEIDSDPAQWRVIDHLDRLCDLLGQVPSRKSGLSWLFGRKPSMPRGLYLWGSVGRGKTMLMDLMLQSAPLEKKTRLHFQTFMADVHARIHTFRQQVKNGAVKDTDPIGPVAAAIAHEITLLCLDEFSVTDIADAMILSRLFAALFENGVVLVTTSNVAPDRLYENGLNRALFLPFVDLLKAHVDTVELDAALDYRLGKSHTDETYFMPADSAARASLDAIFTALTAPETTMPMELMVLGHRVAVPMACQGVARFSYRDLCQTALGANDFIAIGEQFHTVMIDDIPIIAANNHNEAKRFIALIDAFYDRSVKLFVSAAASPEQIYQADEGREAFEFDRTVSRLIEMQSEPYRALPHGHRLASS